MINQVSEDSLAAFAERYARAVASLEKRDVRLDLEKLEADACGVSLERSTVRREGSRERKTSRESGGQSVSEEETTSEDEEEQDRASGSDENDSSSGEEEATSDSEPDSEDESDMEPAIDTPVPGSARNLDHDSKDERGSTATTARVSQVVAEIKLPLVGTGASLKATDSNTRANSCGGSSEAAATATTSREERSSALLHLESSPTSTAGGGPSGASIASRLSELSLAESKGIPPIELGDGAVVGGVGRSGNGKAGDHGDRGYVGSTAKTLIQEL